jgi:hypothetical protein
VEQPLIILTTGKTMVLDELPLEQIAPETTVEHIRDFLAVMFWEWYKTNSDDRLVRVDWFIFHKTLKVADCKPVFELLFGPQPA